MLNFFFNLEFYNSFTDQFTEITAIFFDRKLNVIQEGFYLFYDKWTVLKVILGQTWNYSNLSDFFFWWKKYQTYHKMS